MNNASARYIEVTDAPAHDTVRIRSGALRWEQTNFVSKNKCVLGAVMCFLSPAVEQENITDLGVLVVLFGTHRRVTLDGVSNPRQCQESMLSSHGRDVRCAWHGIFALCALFLFTGCRGHQGHQSTHLTLVPNPPEQCDGAEAKVTERAEKVPRGPRRRRRVR